MNNKEIIKLILNVEYGSVKKKGKINKFYNKTEDWWATNEWVQNGSALDANGVVQVPSFQFLMR